MNGAEAPRARLKQDVEAAVGDWAWEGTQDEIAGRLLSADGVWAASPATAKNLSALATADATAPFSPHSHNAWTSTGNKGVHSAADAPPLASHRANTAHA